MLNGLSELLAEYNVPAAFWMTIKLTVVSAIGALLIGTIIAIMRVSPVAVFRSFGTAYVTLVRNTPLTLIIFFCAFGFYITLQYRLGSQDSPIDVQNFRWGVLALAVYHAAFVAEALRSGINSVPRARLRLLEPSAWTSARRYPTWCCLKLFAGPSHRWATYLSRSPRTPRWWPPSAWLKRPI